MPEGVTEFLTKMVEVLTALFDRKSWPRRRSDRASFMAEFLTPRSGGGRAINHEGRSIDKQTNPRPGTGHYKTRRSQSKCRTKAHA